MSSCIRAGFAKVEITPPLASMATYGIGYWCERHVRFVGVRDPLFVRTLVIELEGGCHVVSSVDSILDSYCFVPLAVKRISEAFRIDDANIFVTCTHTHSSPMIGRNGTTEGAEYGPFVAERIAESAFEAARGVEDCRVTIDTGQIEDVLYNRRPVLKSGRIAELHVALAPEDVLDPGPVNRTMTLVKFQGASGALKGALCHFGIHGVAIQCSNLISSDCMGRAIQAVEGEMDEHAVLLHLNAPCGDIDPVLMGDESALDIMSRRLQAGINTTLRHPDDELKSPEKISARSVVFRARRRETRRPSELQKKRAELLSAAVKHTNASHHSGAGYEAFLLSEEERVSKLPPGIDVPYQILRWGKLVLLGVGGEIFTRQGLDLQSSFPDSILLPVGLTGGAAGYLPSAEMYRQGGYEVTCAQWCPVAAGEAEQLFARIEGDLQQALEEGGFPT